MTESAWLNLVCPKFNYNGEPDKVRPLTEAIKSPKGIGINTMSKSNVAGKFVLAPEVVTEASAPASVLSIVKEEPVVVRKLTLDAKIQKVEDLSLMIDRWRTLSDSRRKLQTFQMQLIH